MSARRLRDHVFSLATHQFPSLPLYLRYIPNQLRSPIIKFQLSSEKSANILCQSLSISTKKHWCIRFGTESGKKWCSFLLSFFHFTSHPCWLGTSTHTNILQRQKLFFQSSTRSVVGKGHSFNSSQVWKLHVRFPILSRRDSPIVISSRVATCHSWFGAIFLWTWLRLPAEPTVRTGGGRFEYFSRPAGNPGLLSSPFLPLITLRSPSLLEGADVLEKRSRTDVQPLHVVVY